MPIRRRSFNVLLLAATIAFTAMPLPAWPQQLLSIREPSAEFTDFAWGSHRIRIAKLKVDHEIDGRLYVRGSFAKKKTVSVYDFDEAGLYRRKIIVASKLNPYLAERHTKTFEKWRAVLTESFGRPKRGICTQDVIVYDQELKERLEEGRSSLSCVWIRGDTIVSLTSARYGEHLRTLVTFHDAQGLPAPSSGSIVSNPGTPANKIEIDEFARTADAFVARLLSQIPFLLMNP